MEELKNAFFKKANPINFHLACLITSIFMFTAMGIFLIKERINYGHTNLVNNYGCFISPTRNLNDLYHIPSPGNTSSLVKKPIYSDFIQGTKILPVNYSCESFRGTAKRLSSVRQLAVEVEIHNSTIKNVSNSFVFFPFAGKMENFIADPHLLMIFVSSTYGLICIVDLLLFYNFSKSITKIWLNYVFLFTLFRKALISIPIQQLLLIHGGVLSTESFSFWSIWILSNHIHRFSELLGSTNVRADDKIHIPYIYFASEALRITFLIVRIMNYGLSLNMGPWGNSFESGAPKLTRNVCLVFLILSFFGESVVTLVFHHIKMRNLKGKTNDSIHEGFEDQSRGHYDVISQMGDSEEIELTERNQEDVLIVQITDIKFSAPYVYLSFDLVVESILITVMFIYITVETSRFEEINCD